VVAAGVAAETAVADVDRRKNHGENQFY
jgi:hypothetical protein